MKVEGMRIVEVNWCAEGLKDKIPTQLGELDGLKELILSNNEISGPLPSAIGKLMSLTYLNLSNNRLDGPLPPELGGLSALTTLHLNNNNFSDSIPSTLANLTNLFGLSLHHNHFTTDVPPDEIVYYSDDDEFSDHEDNDSDVARVQILSFLATLQRFLFKETGYSKFPTQLFLFLLLLLLLLSSFLPLLHAFQPTPANISTPTATTAINPIPAMNLLSLSKILTM